MSEANPYQPPEIEMPLEKQPYPWGRVIGGTLLLVLSFPAAGVAFFASCLAVYDASNNEDTAIGTGAIVGLLALGTMLFAGVWVLVRRPPKTKSPS